MTLGTTIKRLRQARGWTQGQLAMRSGVEQSHLSKIEREVHETVNARVLARIAMALQVSADELMEEAGWLPPSDRADHLRAAEQKLVNTIRAIPTTKVRDRVVEQFTWIAEVARDADLARFRK